MTAEKTYTNRAHDAKPFEVSELILNNGIVVLVDTELLPALRKYNWGMKTEKRSGHRYAQAYISRSIGVKSMHRFIMRPPKGYWVDHINRNGLDNRRCNLRLVTPAQNNWNTRKRARARSKHKGIWWNENIQRWIATITIHGERIYLGCSKDEETAAALYRAGALKHQGEYAPKEVA